MKLAEALALRSDLNKRIAAISQQMLDSAKYQEGTSPAENCADLLVRLEDISTQLQKMIANINTTNLATRLPNGKSLTTAISERDVLLIRISYHRRLADQGVIKHTVQTRSEVRYVSQVNVTELREKADKLSREYRDLDVQIQQANWNTELIEE